MRTSKENEAELSNHRCTVFAPHCCESPEIQAEQNRFPIFCYVVVDAVKYYGKRKILQGCSYEGWLNRAWLIQTISWYLPRRVGWPCPVRFALKRTPVSWVWAIVFVFHMDFTGFLVIVETRKYVCSSIVAASESWMTTIFAIPWYTGIWMWNSQSHWDEVLSWELFMKYRIWDLGKLIYRVNELS